MSEEGPKSKDLTGIHELSLTDAAASESSPFTSDAPPPMEETPIEKIDVFESIDSLPQTDEPPAGGFDFTPHSTDASTTTPAPEPSEFPMIDDSSAAKPSPQGLNEEASQVIPLETMMPEAPASETTPLADSFTHPAATPAVPSNTLQSVKSFAENLRTTQEPVPAAFPFSLLITGELAREEKEKLLDIITRENMGIREVDLEVQFESRKILIPRISEYAGVILIQALRGTAAQMHFAPSDSELLSTSPLETTDQPHPEKTHASATPANQRAEDLPITQDLIFPDSRIVQMIDVITASAALRSEAIVAEHSTEYQRVLDNLQRELKYKAHRKGATGIVSFTIQTVPLTLPSQYRILVVGTAIRHEQASGQKT